MIEILSSTDLASIQDIGRDNYLRYGVGTAGAMDQIALMAGNIFLKNPENVAAIEIPIFPFQVKFLEDIVFSLTGADTNAEIDGESIPPYWVRRARKNQLLTLSAPRYGARAYLGLAGGIDVPIVLGSRSTHLRGEFGGYQGRTLRQGDVLRPMASGHLDTNDPMIMDVGFGAEPPQYALPLGDAAFPTKTFVRVLPAAEYDSYEEDSINSFWSTDWKITGQSDRYGYRLAGEAMIPKQVMELRSHGIVPGVIQVPHNGQPIIQLRDAQPSGGYPKFGTVIEADLWRLGQARPGTQLRFLKVSYEEALQASHAVRNYLHKLRHLSELYGLSLLRS
ncbi:MAG: biotin-dependent carboxyltransferase family protein [Gallionella sp.]|nr:biotin-dependent carboxyltransferase family protein [Gallionella sp.]